MSSNKKQETLTALIDTYGTTVTRRNLIEFEKAGRGNCSFVGTLYRVGRGQYELPAVYDAGAVASKASAIIHDKVTLNA